MEYVRCLEKEKIRKEYKMMILALLSAWLEMALAWDHIVLRT